LLNISCCRCCFCYSCSTQIELLGRLLAEFPSANLAGIAVGNEAISRGDVKERQLLQYIAQVQPPPAA
jgi:exo-beta-1,3-glucanase (GH17 family)